MSGIFGVVNDSAKGCVDDALYGTDYHTHLGTEMASLAFSLSRDGDWVKVHDIKEGAQLRDRFRRDLKELLDDCARSSQQIRAGIGVISDHDYQPVIIQAKFGRFVVVGAGNINNLQVLADEFLKNGSLSSTNFDGSINAIEVVGKLIARKEDLISGIAYMWSKIKGSMSVLILTAEGKVIAARDRFGVTPLTIGKKETEKSSGHAVALESFALDKNGYETCKYLEPGEVVEISNGELNVLRPGDKDKRRVCAFLSIYTAFPAAIIEGVQVEASRQRCGRCLAKDDKTDAKAVFGIPDSGIGHQMGYCQESGLPPCRPVSKYTPTWPRSFTPGDQALRDLIADKKIIFLEQIIREFQKFVLIDDSIVRGTQLQELLSIMRSLGALKLHVRPACPPLMFPCIYLRSTRKIEELATRKAIRRIEGDGTIDISPYLDPTSEKFQQMIENIRQVQDADSLKYPTVSEMVEAIGIPAEKLCTYCWTGKEFK